MTEPLVTPLSTARQETDPIRSLRGELREDLDAVEAEIARVLASETALTREVGQYVRNSRGKQLRPMLTILTAGACGRRGRAVQQTAAALEIVHNATLLHDDVIDKSLLRRGQPTVNARFGDDVAILMADYLYSNAFELALECLKPRVLQFITRVTSRMSEGEMFQIEKRGDLLTEDDYLRIIRAKTAYLFSACCGLGGVLAEASEARIEALTAFGMDFGLAFQITDDVLDYISKDDHFGKAVGTDISAGKQTLPFIHALRSAPEEDRRRMLDAIGCEDGVESLVRTVQRYGGIDYAVTRAGEYVSSAVGRLASLTSTRATEQLRAVAEYLVSRTY